MRKILAGLVLSATLLAVAVPAVAAHECFIVNRSDMGTKGADHSGRWDMLSLADIFGFIHGVVGGPALDASQIEDAVDMAVDQGLPRDGWLVRSDRTIGSGPNLADGKGLDHLADVYGGQIVGIYIQVAGL